MAPLTTCKVNYITSCLLIFEGVGRVAHIIYTVYEYFIQMNKSPLNKVINRG